MNSKQRRSLEAIWAEPLNTSLDWGRIESVFRALGCRVIKAAGSSLTFERQERRTTFHRLNPGKEALRYRVKASREFLHAIGIKP